MVLESQVVDMLENMSKGQAPAGPLPASAAASALIPTPARTSTSAPAENATLSRATILAAETKAKETYAISDDLFNGWTVIELWEYGTPAEILKRVNDFGIFSSDIAVSGESCVSSTSLSGLSKLTLCQRNADIFWRAMALLEAQAAVGEGRKAKARNAVRRARADLQAEYEEREQRRQAREEAARVRREAGKAKRDTKKYLKTGSCVK